MRRTQLILYSAVLSYTLNAMDEKRNEHCISNYNTYHGIAITPQSLLSLAPSMDNELKDVVVPWIYNNKGLLQELLQTPRPLTHDISKEITTKNKLLFEKFRDRVKCLSDFNYVIKPTDNEKFVVKINPLRSRMATLMYATNQGNWYDPSFKRDSADCSKLEGIPTYKHISNVAHYLRLLELEEQKKRNYLKTTPTYLAHIPGQSQECCDANYVAVQQYVPTFVDFRFLEKEDNPKFIEIIKNLSPELLQEIHDAIKYAVLWDSFPNLGITQQGECYYLDVEGPYNHCPQFFYYQGLEGYKKYLEHVCYGLERMSERLKEIDPQQYERWKRICDEHDQDLMAEFKKYDIEPYFFVNGDIKRK